MIYHSQTRQQKHHIEVPSGMGKTIHAKTEENWKWDKEKAAEK